MNTKQIRKEKSAEEKGENGFALDLIPQRNTQI